MVTLQTVAERAGVSAAVVSAAVSGSKSVRMSPSTRKRVEEAIRELGYVTNHAAKALKTSRTGLVATITPNLSNPVFDEALRGVQDAADGNQGAILLSDSDRVSPGSNLLSRLVGTGMVDGFLLRFPTAEEENISIFQQRNVPFVVLNGPADGVNVCVWVDDYRGIFVGTSHLLKLGHRRIAMLGGPLAPFTEDARGAGFSHAFSALDLTPPPDAIVRGYDPAAIRSKVWQLMQSPEPPTAVIIDDVVAAPGLIAAVAELGLRLPDDLSVVAYHDVPQADFYRPALTTIKMPLYEAGVRAYEVLQRMIAGEKVKSHIVRRPAPKIIDRGSTAAILAKQQGP